jgi:hypothetical protein
LSPIERSGFNKGEIESIPPTRRRDRTVVGVGFSRGPRSIQSFPPLASNESQIAKGNCVMARREILDRTQKHVDPFRITKGKTFRLKNFKEIVLTAIYPSVRRLSPTAW